MQALEATTGATIPTCSDTLEELQQTFRDGNTIMAFASCDGNTGTNEYLHICMRASISKNWPTVSWTTSTSLRILGENILIKFQSFPVELTIYRIAAISELPAIDHLSHSCNTRATRDGYHRHSLLEESDRFIKSLKSCHRHQRIRYSDCHQTSSKV